MLHGWPQENKPDKAGGDRKNGVAKQGTRPGQGGDKRADNADKQDTQTRKRPGEGPDKDQGGEERADVADTAIMASPLFLRENPNSKYDL